MMASSRFLEQLVILEEATALAYLGCYRRADRGGTENSGPENSDLGRTWLRLAAQARERARLLEVLAEEFVYSEIPYSGAALDILRQKVGNALATALGRDLDASRALEIAGDLIDSEIWQISVTLLAHGRAARIRRRLHSLVPGSLPVREAGLARRVARGDGMDRTAPAVQWLDTTTASRV